MHNYCPPCGVKHPREKRKRKGGSHIKTIVLFTQKYPVLSYESKIYSGVFIQPELPTY